MGPDQGFRKKQQNNQMKTGEEEEQENDDVEGQNREIDLLEKGQIRQSEAHQSRITNTFINDHHRQEHLNFDIDIFDEEHITPSLIKENRTEDTKENENKNGRIPFNIDSNEKDNNNNNDNDVKG